MSVILSIETSTEVCSVAFHQSETLLADFNLHVEKAHSKSLANLVDIGFKHTGIDKKELSAVAISSGPGSYTGLRIGTSLAKGMCFSLDIPLIEVSSLMGMAQGVSNTNLSRAWLCPMIDARRMEVYCLIVDSDMNTMSSTKAQVIDENSFSDFLEKHEILFFGNGAAKCKSLLDRKKNATFIDNYKMSAADIGQIAIEKFKIKDFADLAYFEPNYLKEFVAGKPKSLI